MSKSNLLLYKRKNGYWYLLIDDGDGKTRWKSTRQKHRTDAVNYLRQKEATERELPTIAPFTTIRQHPPRRTNPRTITLAVSLCGILSTVDDIDPITNHSIT